MRYATVLFYSMFIEFFAGSKFEVEVQTLRQKYVILGNAVYRVRTFEVVEIKPHDFYPLVLYLTAKYTLISRANLILNYHSLSFHITPKLAVKVTNFLVSRYQVQGVRDTCTSTKFITQVNTYFLRLQKMLKKILKIGNKF
jgi:hypothetical protein